MSRSLNKVSLIGNLGADPEVRSTSNGSRVATLSLATSRRWKNQSGEQQEKTEWHRVVAWNNKGSTLADLAERYCKKGDKIYVEGSIEYRSWQDREGPNPVHHRDHGPRDHPPERQERRGGVVHPGQQGGRGIGGRAQGKGPVVRGLPRGARRRGRRPAVLGSPIGRQNRAVPALDVGAARILAMPARKGCNHSRGQPQFFGRWDLPSGRASRGSGLGGPGPAPLRHSSITAFSPRSWPVTPEGVPRLALVLLGFGQNRL